MRPAALWYSIVLIGGACTEIESFARRVAVVGDVAIESPYAPEPVTSDVGSVYFTVRNLGDHPERLLSVAVDAAEDVSLHGQDRLGGGVRMVPVQSIEIPPHGSIALEPGGFHVMLRQLKHHYRAGDSLAVTIVLARAGSTTWFAPVISYVDVVERLDVSGGTGQH